MSNNFVLKGNICYSKTLNKIETVENAFLVCINGKSKGVFVNLPEEFKDLQIIDHGKNVIIPGLVDLHIHAPQFTFRGLGMDLELLEWLDTQTFPEESKYSDLDYAEKAYSYFVDELKKGATTRACIFATIHLPATYLLMDKLEAAGLVTMVGKVNMDRNSPDYLREETAEISANNTINWLENISGKYKNTSPIITPRFIPSCTDELMLRLKDIQQAYKLPVQSHLSENQGEIEWVKELCPNAKFYGDAYNNFNMFGNDVKTIMAHCVWPTDDEMDLICKNKVFVAHCPQSNANLSSGIAPIRRFLQKNANVGLGSDVAGGCHPSIFRAMADTIMFSKMRWQLVDKSEPAITLAEAFFLATLGGGEFFGKVGSFDEGYEFDAVVLDDSNLKSARDLSLIERLARIIYLSDNNNIAAKYVRGSKSL